MKKWFLVLLLVSVFSLSACFQKKFDVASVTIYFDAEGVMVVEPDMEARTLGVVFEEGAEEMEGMVGGEFYDRFEEILRQLEKYEKDYVGAEAVPNSTLVVSWVKSSGQNYQKGDFLDSDEVESFGSFYDDVAELLTEEAPV